MNILINCSNIKIGGGIQVAHSFINELKEKENDSFTIVLSSTLIQQIDTKKFPTHISFCQYDIPANPKNAIFSNNGYLNSLVKENQIDKVFTVFGPSYWKPKVPHVCGYAKSHYVYRNSPFFKQISFKEKVVLKFKEFFHLLDFK